MEADLAGVSEAPLKWELEIETGAVRRLHQRRGPGPLPVVPEAVAVLEDRPRRHGSAGHVPAPETHQEAMRALDVGLTAWIEGASGDSHFLMEFSLRLQRLERDGLGDLLFRLLRALGRMRLCRFRCHLRSPILRSRGMMWSSSWWIPRSGSSQQKS